MRTQSGALGGGVAVPVGEFSVSPTSPQDVSPGRMSVAILPGIERACAMAAEASPATECDERARRTQWLKGRARPSISEASGGSYFKCAVAWSPTMLIMPDLARRALWMLARPFARPGP